MKQQAKPCPFCGRPAEILDSLIPGARCSNEYVGKCPVDYMPLDDWNNRPVEDALLEACKAAIEPCSCYSGDYSPVVLALKAAIARAEGDA